MSDDLREVEGIIAKGLKPYTDYLVTQGHLTGVANDTWHLWLARRCADDVFAALRQVEQRTIERAAQVAQSATAGSDATDHWWGGYCAASIEIATAIRALSTPKNTT